MIIEILFKRNDTLLSMKFERAGFSDHMVPENRTKYYFIHHFRLIQSVWPRFLLLVMGASSEVFNCLQTETSV